ncbi:MAG: DUF202 domain-containing protein [Phycisphaerae bacterium]|nr:DUF202 domain-containing protein [Phycisphaerae bacterium]
MEGTGENKRGPQGEGCGPAAEADEASLQLSHTRTNLSVMRTMMSADRTLMAWTRTALSMISFGFTIYKFMQYMQEQGANVIKNPYGPRNFGVALIALGIFSLIIACLQHWQVQKKIDPAGKSHFSLPFAVAGLIGAVGFLALANMIFKIGPF